jgi:hypothetical protein
LVLVVALTGVNGKCAAYQPIWQRIARSIHHCPFRVRERVPTRRHRSHCQIQCSAGCLLLIGSDEDPSRSLPSGGGRLAPSRYSCGARDRRSHSIHSAGARCLCNGPLLVSSLREPERAYRLQTPVAIRKHPLFETHRRRAHLQRHERVHVQVLRVASNGLRWPPSSSARCSQPPKRVRSGQSLPSGRTCIPDCCASYAGLTRWQQKTSKPRPGLQPLKTSRASMVMKNSSARGCSGSRGTVSSTGGGARSADAPLR